MDTKEIGMRLVELCDNGENLTAVEELYSQDVESVEPFEVEGTMPRVAKGLDAIRGKNEWFMNAHEVHSTSAQGPYLHGDDQFGVILEMDVTYKENNKRSKMKELGVYTVENGKIVKEEFFFTPGID